MNSNQVRIKSILFARMNFNVSSKVNFVQIQICTWFIISDALKFYIHIYVDHEKTLNIFCVLFDTAHKNYFFAPERVILYKILMCHKENSVNLILYMIHQSGCSMLRKMVTVRHHNGTNMCQISTRWANFRRKNFRWLKSFPKVITDRRFLKV